MSRVAETGPRSKFGAEPRGSEPRPSARPKIIGLVGGVASGKSFVAREFERLGAGRLDADLAGHEVLASDDVRRALVERWGPEILDSKGQPDRRQIAARVFAPDPEGPRELEFLESVTHPRIGERITAQLREMLERGPSMVVLDAPVMVKAGWHRLCDHVVFIEAAADVRWQRAEQRGWSPSEFDAREAAQESLDEKRRLADFVIDNSGSPSATQAQVQRLWQQLTS